MRKDSEACMELVRYVKDISLSHYISRTCCIESYRIEL